MLVNTGVSTYPHLHTSTCHGVQQIHVWVTFDAGWSADQITCFVGKVLCEVGWHWCACTCLWGEPLMHAPHSFPAPCDGSVDDYIHWGTPRTTDMGVRSTQWQGAKLGKSESSIDIKSCGAILLFTGLVQFIENVKAPQYHHVHQKVVNMLAHTTWTTIHYHHTT